MSTYNSWNSPFWAPYLILCLYLPFCCIVYLSPNLCDFFRYTFQTCPLRLHPLPQKEEAAAAAEEEEESLKLGLPLLAAEWGLAMGFGLSHFSKLLHFKLLQMLLAPSAASLLLKLFPTFFRYPFTHTHTFHIPLCLFLSMDVFNY